MTEKIKAQADEENIIRLDNLTELEKRVLRSMAKDMEESHIKIEKA